MTLRSVVALNPEQQIAVDTRRGAVVCVAAPGSGKTSVIVKRALVLLDTGVRPEKLLSLTFTVEAAKEMNERTGRRKTQPRIFRTFHSWALAFARQEREFFPYQLEPTIIPTKGENIRALGRIVGQLQEIDFKEAISYISLMKRRGIGPVQALDQAEHALERLYAQAYQRYETVMRTAGPNRLALLDFDSLLCETVKLLEKNAAVRERWQYEFVQVDEAQDTDRVQWSIVQLISEQHGNVFAVGDENQGMYSWRGAETYLSDRFRVRFPDAVVLSLSQNYRSTGEIVDYCKQIAPIQNDTIKNFRTANDRGVAPEFRLYGNEDQEATAIVNSTLDLSHTAVLARTNRQLRPFEDECSERGIKYKRLGKSGFWNRPEVKDVILWVKAALDPSGANVVRALKTHCDATRFVRKVDIQADTALTDLLYGAQGPTIRGVYDLMTALHHTPTASMEMLLRQAGFLSYYDVEEDQGATIDNDPRENILSLVSIAERRGGLHGFLEFTQRVAKANRARTGFLTISTIHQAKGKEWLNVHLVGVNDGMLPHSKGDVEEEKRIYFVACSRAAQRLVISANGVPSDFIKHQVKDSRGAYKVTLDLHKDFALQAGSPY